MKAGSTLSSKFTGAQGYTIHPLTGRKIEGGGKVTKKDMNRLNAIVNKAPSLDNLVFWQRFYNLDREGREAYLEAFETTFRIR